MIPKYKKFEQVFNKTQIHKKNLVAWLSCFNEEELEFLSLRLTSYMREYIESKKLNINIEQDYDIDSDSFHILAIYLYKFPHEPEEGTIVFYFFSDGQFNWNDNVDCLHDHEKSLIPKEGKKWKDGINAIKSLINSFTEIPTP